MAEFWAEHLREWGSEHRCPTCGAFTKYYADCAGYLGKARKSDGTYYETVLVCNPPSSCGGATLYECTDESCGWWWREPNNRAIKSWNGTLRVYIEMGPEPMWLQGEREREATNQEED